MLNLNTNLLRLIFLLIIMFSFNNNEIFCRIRNGNPSNYRLLLQSLVPGDTLLLSSGTYDKRLPIHNLNGLVHNPIVITGARNATRPVFLGQSGYNTVSIVNSSYIEIYHLELDGRNLYVDGVKAEGHADWAHHITIEDLLIYGHDADQQIVGISTKCPAWNWKICRNVITGAGTGLYLGDSEGSAPFINGLIEYNLIVNTRGYNMQIKHQRSRPNIAGIPSNGTTIIRHNVFSKDQNSSSGAGARPNVLVGHWPLSGDGATDCYQIYGNFFYNNPHESLFQGEGNIALHNNLFLNNYGPAIRIQPHNDVPKMIRIFYNTVIASGTGIKVTGGFENYQQIVMANSSFASTSIQAPDQQDNVKASYLEASKYLNNPTGKFNDLDLYPKTGMLKGNSINTSLFEDFIDWDRDFNGNKRNGIYRGAYSGEGLNPGWLPKLEIKKLSIIDDIAPATVNDLKIKNHNNSSITLSWTAPGDDGKQGGPVCNYDIRYSEKLPNNDINQWFTAANKLSISILPGKPGYRESITFDAAYTEKKYIFILRSVDDVGNISDFSNLASLTTVLPFPNRSTEPRNFNLQQNFPNPFNAETIINYSLTKNTMDEFISIPIPISLKINNLSGNLITTLVNEKKVPGRYAMKWNGKNEDGATVPSGIYVYNMSAEKVNIVSRKLTLIR